MDVAQAECPRCHGALATEDVVNEDVAPRNKCTMVHCDFCAVGTETLWELGPDGKFHEKFSIEFARDKDAVEYGKFLQRMKDRRVAA